MAATLRCNSLKGALPTRQARVAPLVPARGRSPVSRTAQVAAAVPGECGGAGGSPLAKVTFSTRLAPAAAALHPASRPGDQSPMPAAPSSRRQQQRRCGGPRPACGCGRCRARAAQRPEQHAAPRRSGAAASARFQLDLTPATAPLLPCPQSLMSLASWSRRPPTSTPWACLSRWSTGDTPVSRFYKQRRVTDQATSNQQITRCTHQLCSCQLPGLTGPCMLFFAASCLRPSCKSAHRLAAAGGRQLRSCWRPSCVLRTSSCSRPRYPPATQATWRWCCSLWAATAAGSAGRSASPMMG